jgi:16S rRNA (guanine1207-N2)-methyltransferase
MSRETLRTLFHPFESGVLTPPGSGAHVLFLGARPGFRLPDSLVAELSCVQGFRPDFLALSREGRRVSPMPEGGDFDLALVLCGRHRGENELRVAEAVERVGESGLVVVAGGKEDGVASLAKRLDGAVELEGRVPKHHGVVFWFRAPSDRGTVVEALRHRNPGGLVEGRFATAPGMFSHDHIDPGSRLLAEALPGELKGKVADFCAGWGYLSAEIAARCPGATHLDLYEADFASLEAARRNLAGVSGATFGFHWVDLLSEPVERRHDAIVMNPPFHRGRAAEPEIGTRLIGAAAKALKSGGTLYLVANKGLPYEKLLATAFASCRQIAADSAFRVVAATR